jgi:hypothetical protein
MNNPTSNVTPITDKQPAPAARFIITATVDGFPVSIEVEGKAGDLRALVDRLKAIGATPPAAGVQTPAPTKAAADEDTPVCEYHGKMKMGNYGWFCPKKMGDGSYCKSKA